jgi:hypothetical protein
MSIHEPKHTTENIRRLRTKVAEDASFASLVFAMREMMEEQEAVPNQMRAALRLVLHNASWRTYKRTQDESLFEEEEEDVEEDGCDPLEL